MKLAVVGDIHTHFDDADVAFLNSADVDGVLFVGDLCNYWWWEGYAAARQMARLEKTAVFIPGNHDTAHLFHILADVFHIGWLERVSAVGQRRRLAALQKMLLPVVMGGYSRHTFRAQDLTLDVIVGRPFSSGGAGLTYPTILRQAYGISSLAESADRLKQLVDESQADALLFLGHNGPSGLGSEAHAIWGVDFRPEAGDHGDGDLETAVAYARAQGKRVTAVVGGHMHHQLKNGGQRQWHIIQNGIHYINAARVPRIEQNNHHIVLLHITQETIDVQPVFFENRD